jgi:hypothetical protein
MDVANGPLVEAFRVKKRQLRASIVFDCRYGTRERRLLRFACPLMAVPGPVTSAMSAGCHALIRDRRAACVTSAADIIAHMPL